MTSSRWLPLPSRCRWTLRRPAMVKTMKSCGRHVGKHLEQIRSLPRNLSSGSGSAPIRFGNCTRGRLQGIFGLTPDRTHHRSPACSRPQLTTRWFKMNYQQYARVLSYNTPRSARVGSFHILASFGIGPRLPKLAGAQSDSGACLS